MIEQPSGDLERSAPRVADAVRRQLGRPLRAAALAALCAAGAARPAGRRLAAAVSRAGGRWRWPSCRVGSAYPNPWYVVLFPVGAIVMRGAGCTYNDIVDRDFDAGVARTRSRPMPSGQVSSPRRGVPGRAVLAGFLILVQFNRFTIVLGRRPRCSVADLSVHEALHLLAAIGPGPRLQLGRADRLGRGQGHARAPAAPALCRLGAVDHRLRHHLCPPGQGGRPDGSA